MFTCLAHNFFLYLTLAYHIWYMGLSLWEDVICAFMFLIRFWPQGQIYRLLSCPHVWPVTSVCFDIGTPYLAHWSITMRGCVKYIHDPDTTLTFDLKVKFIGFMTWLCVQASAFLSFDIVILCSAPECLSLIHIWRCRRYAVCRSRWSPYH